MRTLLSMNLTNMMMCDMAANMYKGRLISVRINS